jgi:hypothetical protein
MTIWTIQSGRYRTEVDDCLELDRFERITHGRGGECPVSSHDSRTRGRLRERGGAKSRRKAKSINGVHRRGSFKHANLAF